MYASKTPLKMSKESRTLKHSKRGEGEVKDAMKIVRELKICNKNKSIACKIVFGLST